MIKKLENWYLSLRRQFSQSDPMEQAKFAAWGIKYAFWLLTFLVSAIVLIYPYLSTEWLTLVITAIVLIFLIVGIYKGSKIRSNFLINKAIRESEYGDIEEAERNLKKALEIAIKNVDDYQILLISHKLNDIYKKQKQFKKSISIQKNIHDTYKRLMESNPNDIELKRSAFVVYAGSGLVSLMQGERDEALRVCTEAEKLREKFTDDNSYNDDDDVKILGANLIIHATLAILSDENRDESVQEFYRIFEKLQSRDQLTKRDIVLLKYFGIEMQKINRKNNQEGV